MKQEERNKAVVRELTEHIWNRCALDRIPEFYASNYVADYRPYVPLREGLAAVRGMVEGAWKTFPDYHEELHTVIAEASFVVAHFTISGTQSGPWGVIPGTGKRLSYDEIVILELENEKVVRQRGIADNLAAFRQLGIMPGKSY